MAASSAVALRCCNSNFRPWRAAHAAQLRPEADADLAALDPRRLGLLRWADGEGEGFRELPLVSGGVVEVEIVTGSVVHRRPFDW